MSKEKQKTLDTMQSELAKSIVLACVRNTFLEDLHSGKVPDTKTGDYSDVKVVTPFGEIPWNDLSRLNDDEMKILMKEMVDKIYTILVRLEEPGFIEALKKLASPYIVDWDKPELLNSFVLKKE